MNGLQHFEEFEAVLANYKPSEAAEATLAKTRLALMVAASSSGRNTIINHLMKLGGYHFIVSDTTRKPRENDGIMELSGREYWFRTEEELLGDLKLGAFLEAEIIHGQQVSGISIRELEVAQEQHKTAITDIDIGGIQNILEVKPDTIAIAVLPPSFKEWQHRITNRSAMPADEWRRRMQTAIRIFTSMLANPSFQFHISNEINASVAEVDKIVHDGGQVAALQVAGRELTKQLLRDTEAALQKDALS